MRRPRPATVIDNEDSVWNLYHTAAGSAPDVKGVGYSSFCHLWNQLLLVDRYEQCLSCQMGLFHHPLLTATSHQPAILCQCTILFDFAQQAHYPSNPLQPGPIYFLTPRKAALFGICSKAIPRQVDFIIN